MHRTNNSNQEKVKTRRGHRRVKSSGARLPSVNGSHRIDSRTDEQSPCTYQIPHLFGSKGINHESSFSKTDKISSISPTSQQSRPSRSLVSEAINKDIKRSPKIALKKSHTFAFSSSTKDEPREEFDLTYSAKLASYKMKRSQTYSHRAEFQVKQKPISKTLELKRSPKVGTYEMKNSQTFAIDSSTRDDLQTEPDWIGLNQRMNSSRIDRDLLPLPKVAAGYKMKKSLSHGPTSMENGDNSREFDAFGMKEWSWSLETQLDRFSSLFALKKDTKEDRNVFSLSDDEDTIEIFQSDRVIKQGIKSRNDTKGAAKKQKSKKNDKKQNKATKDLPKPEWLQRGKSDSSESRKSQESKEIETRRDLISKIRRNRLKFFGRGAQEPTPTPLAALSHCKGEDMSPQSSSSDSHRGYQKRNCFTSFAGRKPSDVRQSRNKNCLNTFINNTKPVEYQFGSFSSSDLSDVSKTMKIDSQPSCSSKKLHVRTEKALHIEKTSDSRAKSKFRKQKLKIFVPSNNNVKPILSPTEPFDPNSINVPDSILTTQDDDDSVTSNTSSFSFASSHYSQSQAIPTTPSSRSIASTPRYNVVQVDQTSKGLLSDYENGYASDCASTCSQSSILSTSSYSSVYTDTSSIRDPCAKKSRKVQRSKKLRQLDADGDVWIEKLFMSKKTGKKRTYFVSVKTGERVRGEPPSGASHVLYAADLVHKQGRRDGTGQETIILCK